MNTNYGKDEGFSRLRWSIVSIGFALVAAFFLLTEHTAHVFGALPYLLLLACPLMHLFGHHRHHGQRADKTAGSGETKPSSQSEGSHHHAH